MSDGLRKQISRIRDLRRAFRGTFCGEDGKPHVNGRDALLELRRFCYGAKPTIKMAAGRIDPYASIAAAARQEVYQRVLHLINATDEDLAMMQRIADQQELANE